MKTNLKIFSMLLCLNLSTFQAFSSTILEDEPSQNVNTVPIAFNNDMTATTAQGVTRRSATPLNNLRAYLGGALVLVSQVSGTMAGASDISFDDSICSWNSTSRHISCVCPVAAGTSPGDFYANNIGLILTTTVCSILIAPKINEKIITPTFDYISNRFFKTTIDDVPLLPEATPPKPLKKIWKTIYEFAGNHSYQNKLRDYEAANLPKKFVEEIRLIDEVLSNKKGWAKEKLMRNKKFFGFSYANATLNIQIRDFSVQELLQEQLEKVENNDRLNAWKQFANPLREKNDDALIKAMPDDVYHAILRLSVNMDQNPGVKFEKSADNSLIIININGISVRIAKTYQANVN